MRSALEPRRHFQVTRVYRFNAGHRLYHPDRSDSWNLEVFGKCSYKGGHGHNYTLEVTISGAVDPETGWISNAKALDPLVKEHIVEWLDHRNLNQVLDLSAGPTPTTEVLIVEIWDRLAPLVAPPARLFGLRISETAKNSFEYFGGREGR